MPECTFQRGSLKPRTNLRVELLRAELNRFSVSGRTSSATLSSSSGEFIQVVGGRFTCAVERWDAARRVRLRAWQPEPVVPWEDGVLLAFTAGCVPLRRDEWFKIDQVIELFISFLESAPYPARIGWRDVTHLANIEHTVTDPMFPRRSET